MTAKTLPEPPELGPLPEGDRFADATKFRRLGVGGGDSLYECWGEAVKAYAASQVAAERERLSKELEKARKDAELAWLQVSYYAKAAGLFDR